VHPATGLSTTAVRMFMEEVGRFHDFARMLLPSNVKNENTNILISF
jgi:hypothetical protein